MNQMEASLKRKYERLLEYLKIRDPMAVAFSGGVDSVFLLHAAHQVKGSDLLALTVKTPYIPDWEIREAADFTRVHGIEHQLVEIEVPDQIMDNPTNRCYLCKSFLFTLLKKEAAKRQFHLLADGTNADDLNEHRPGMKALRELKVISPLLENGFTKKEIRAVSKELGLPTWEKPAYACLLTRIPYDTRISENMLKRIERAETYLMDLGIRAVRVRAHGRIARIETEQKYIARILEEKWMNRISRQLKRYGFQYVTLDLEGYRTGGIEELFKNKSDDR